MRAKTGLLAEWRSAGWTIPSGRRPLLRRRGMVVVSFEGPAQDHARDHDPDQDLRKIEAVKEMEAGEAVEVHRALSFGLDPVPGPLPLNL